MAKHSYAAGMQYGFLTIQRVEKDRAFCLCSCGRKTEVCKYNLGNGHTKSCGCHQRKIATKHGGVKHKKEYAAWKALIARCTDATHESYADYGGRGITVANDWLQDFNAFFSALGNAPSARHSIERKDNNKGYCAENCRWATMKEQARNRRNNRLINYKGADYFLLDLANLLGINPITLGQRIRRGMRDFGRPVAHKRNHHDHQAAPGTR